MSRPRFSPRVSHWKYLCVTAIAAPLAVTVVPGDSALLRFQVAGGSADYAYVTRGCNGEIVSARKLSFREAGAAADVRFSGPWHAGLRATHLSPYPGQGIEGVNIWNPYLAGEWHEFGFGLGTVAQPDRPELLDFDHSAVSGHLRFGSEAGGHFLFQVSEGVPLYTTGLADLGYAFRPARSVDFMVGVGTPDPYDHFGFLAKANVRAGSHLGIQLRGRYGTSGGVDEKAVAFGISYDILGHRHAGASPALADTTAKDSS